MAYLKKQNIETRPFFYPMHIMPVHNQGECHLPISVDISKRGINLPTFYDLTRQEVEYISSKIREYFMGK
jgi:perosamine synthetase